MASVVAESMALRRISARTALPAPASPPTLSYCLPGEMRLPVFSGLKLRMSSKRSSGVGLFSTGRSFRVPCGARHGIVCQVQETANDIPSVTDATWESLVLKADCPVVVEFWAPWCGPCRMLHPVIGELADEYTGRLDCFKLNTDESPSIATQYGVRGIPTIMIFSNGEKKETVIGAVPKTTIEKSVEKFVQKTNN